MNEIDELLSEAKALAKRYRKLTGKPLGITGEVAEVAAARLLGLELADARQSGYDAIRHENGKSEKIQIKGRCIPDGANPGQRLGTIKLDKEWDTVLLVLMDEDLEVTRIYEAERSHIERALLAPGSKARNERGALSINKFKSIGREIWKNKSNDAGLHRNNEPSSLTGASEMRQRNFMRELYKKHNGNKDMIIKEYAEGERQGVVIREQNQHQLTVEAYAQALYKDGIRKGWIREGMT